MTEKEKVLLLSWFVNEQTRIENEIAEKVAALRFRHISLNDCLELALLKQRLEDFIDFSHICVTLLHLGNY